MAIEYVDSTQLDSDLTSVANAIRAKSGGSSQLAFPAGFVSEIQAIPSGGGGGLEEFDYTFTTDYSTNGISSHNLGSLLRTAAGTEIVFAYEPNVDPQDTSYSRIIYFASPTYAVQQWRVYNKDKTIIQNAQGSGTFYIPIGTKYTCYKGWA